MTKTIDTEIVTIAPKLLRAHPQNTRSSLKPADVDDLVTLIAAQGQQQPCVVRPLPGPDAAGLFQIILGHRRAKACEVLGTDAQCIVLEDLDDDRAVAILLADNPAHLAPDPMRESEAVAALLERPGWNLQRAAEALGKSRRWVALRANLRNLSDRIRPLLAAHYCPLSKWPVDWLERVAALSVDDQHRFVKELDPKGNRYEWRHLENDRIATVEHLDKALAEFTNKLSRAPWKLDDATLVAAAGACTTCPKQSGSMPGLFGDDDGKADPKKDVCLDGTCWKKKLAAHINRKGADLKEKHPDLVAVDGEYDYYAASADRRLPTPRGVKKLPRESTVSAKKGEKGAIPAFVVSGKGKGTMKWVKVRPEGRGAATAAKALSPEQKKKQEGLARAAKRLGLVREQLCSAIRKLPFPQSTDAAGNVVVVMHLFGTGEGEYDTGKREKRLVALAKDGPGLMASLAAMWKDARDYVAQSFDSDYYNRDGIDDATEEEAVASLLGIDLVPFKAKALEEVPEPVGELPAAKAKKSCRECGCTEDRACDDGMGGGCAWSVNPKTKKETDLCTTCAARKNLKGKGKKGRRKAPVADTADSAASPAGR